MADAQQSSGLNPEQYLGVVRAALEPDERKFFKAYLGQGSPDIGDYLSPQGRFAEARQLREHITRTVLQHAIAQSQAPTVGEAQTLFPGHKELIPESAYKTTPQAPLQANEMPVLTGMQRETVPDNRFQGPMPGVMTPLGEAAVKWFGATNENPLNHEDTRNFSERGPEFYQEGPRPTRVVETGVYGPDMAPSQATELDKNMPLPPVFQAQLGAMQHQLSNRQPQPHYPSAEEQKLQLGMDLGMKAWQEKNPGKVITAGDLNDIYTQVTGLYDKSPRPGSLNERGEKAKVAQEEAKANVAPQRQQAELDDLKARTDENIAKENEIRILMDAKKRKLEAEANAANAAGSKESMKAYFQEQAALLDRAGRMMNMAIEGRKSGKMDDKSYTFLMNEALADMNVNATAGQAERNWFQEHFGTKGAVEVGPRSGNEPMRRMPGAPYQWTNPGGQQGESVTQAPSSTETKPADEAELKAFGRTLKEGETKPFKGSRWTRKGGKLIEVK